MEDLQKALQEQGGKAEDVSVHLLPACPPLVLPSNLPFSPPHCCLMPYEGHCEYHGPGRHPIVTTQVFRPCSPPLTPCCFSPPAHPAEEEAGRSPVSAESHHSWGGNQWAKVWRIVGEEVPSAQVKYSLCFETGCRTVV